MYPKSWALFAAMEKRTNLYAEGDSEGIKALEKELLAQNATQGLVLHRGADEDQFATARPLYLHCLPADINDVSCVDGEVEASVFDRYRDPSLQGGLFKPHIIAAMIFLAKVKDPQATLKALRSAAWPAGSRSKICKFLPKGPPATSRYSGILRAGPGSFSARAQAGMPCGRPPLRIP